MRRAAAAALAVLALATGFAAGYAAGRRPDRAPDPARRQLADLCHRAARAVAAGDALSALHGLLGTSCVPPAGDRAARNAAADAWTVALDRCLADRRACAAAAALAEQHAAQLSRGR